MTKPKTPLLNKLNYPVPKHANSILYMFGGISAFAFVILILSGIYLSQFYSSTPVDANSSIVNGIQNIPLVDFMRSLHFWTANLVVGLLFIHIIRVFITGSYKKPRRLTWLTGVGLLAITIIYIFVGTVLKWDQEGVEALGHMQESLNIFGINIGITNAGIPVITQLYSWHTTILLLALISLLAVHMFLIKIHGISSRAVKGATTGETAGTGSSGFLTHLRRLAGFGLLFFTVAGLLAILLPAPLGYQGILNQEVTKPLWMFWPFFGLEDFFGIKGLVYGMLIFFVVLAAIPFIDRSPYLHWSKRKLILAFGAVFLATIIGLGVYSRLRPADAHLSMESDDTMAVTATAENQKLSHQRLRNEAVFLVPLLAASGAVGTYFAYKRRD